VPISLWCSSGSGRCNLTYHRAPFRATKSLLDRRSFPLGYLSEAIRHGNPAVPISTRALQRRRSDTADYRGKTRKCSETMQNGRKRTRGSEERASGKLTNEKETKTNGGGGKRAATLHTFIRNRTAEEELRSLLLSYYKPP
jgi:hypothetical protein